MRRLSLRRTPTGLRLSNPTTSYIRQRSQSGKSTWLLMAFMLLLRPGLCLAPCRIACLNLERVQMLQPPDGEVCRALAAVLGMPACPWSLAASSVAETTA